jgi:hypothetical protein
MVNLIAKIIVYIYSEFIIYKCGRRTNGSRVLRGGTAAVQIENNDELTSKAEAISTFSFLNEEIEKYITFVQEMILCNLK